MKNTNNQTKRAMEMMEYISPRCKEFGITLTSVICQSPNDVMFGASGRAGTDYDNNNIDDYGEL